MIQYPSKIKKGDLIGVTAPSSGIVGNPYLPRLENAHKNFLELGYKIIETDNVRKHSKLVSSDGKTRSEEFMALWKNKNINWIILASGGEFLIDMLPHIEKNSIEKFTPKWIQGYSDISLLLHYITTNFNIATVHNASFHTYGMMPLDKTLIETIDILQNCNVSEQLSGEKYQIESLHKIDGKELSPFNLTETVEYKNLYNKEIEKISGRLIGGCVDVLVQLPGTELDNTVKFCNQFEEGMLWYLENCELTCPSLYRALLQMKNSGWFKNANGFLIGRTYSKESVEDFTYEDVLHQIFDDMDVPVIYDVDIGHVAPQWTMINGALGEFEYNNGEGKIIQKMI
jgi:Uncharacterized proteins, homologs of microcin C7 resistance protein MccF